LIYASPLGTPGSPFYEYDLPIPNDSSLVGLVLCAQQIHQGGIPFGPFPFPCVEISDGLMITVQP